LTMRCHPWTKEVFSRHFLDLTSLAYKEPHW
jgi:hypothetical protein